MVSCGTVWEKGDGGNGGGGDVQGIFRPRHGCRRL